MSKSELSINTKNLIAFFAIAFVFILVTVSAINWLSVKQDEPQPSSPPRNTTFESIDCPHDFAIYNQTKVTGQTAQLIGEKTKMFAANGAFINRKIVITKNETTDSKVACGYLLVRAGTETYGSLQTWENIYINPDNFGGHLDTSDQFGLGDGREFSEILLALDDIRYWKTRTDRTRGNLLKADWAALFNVSEHVTFQIALNTEDNTGFIDEVSITYKCWDPKTGEENIGCKLEVTGDTSTETNELI